MRKFLLLWPTLVLCMLAGISAKAQTLSKGELEEEAYHYYSIGDYATAYDYFDQLNAKYPKLDYKFRLGICCLHYPEKKARAIEIFTDLKNEAKTPEGDYYLGKAYHVNYRFNDAIPLLESYIAAKENSNKKDDKELVADARRTMQNCQNGKTLIDNKVIADIVNIGGPINTEELEGSPIISTDESIIIFTYAGKKSMGGKLNEDLKPDDKEGMYREDVFMSVKGPDSLWREPVGISSVNTLGNDAAIAISPDGTTLFTFASNNDAGDIFVSRLNGTEWSKPERLNSNINTDAWEGSCSISADGNFLYFASERPGGFGKRDIYVSEKANGDWGPAKNLGSTINTELNDDAPFIHPDGITLFFSSQGHSSIGGYDIMFSVKKDNEWLEPKNMGLPLNTTEDDRYYVINSRGDKGFFSSDRGGAGGKGKQDIYMVTPGILGEKPVVALLKGLVYGDDKPIEAKIEVLKISQKENIGPYYSNNKTGKYLMALSPGFVYRIKVVSQGYEPIEEDLDIEGLSKYMETNKDFYLYSPGATPTVVATPTTPLVEPTNTVVITPTVAVTNTAVPVENTVTVAVTPTVAVEPPATEVAVTKTTSVSTKTKTVKPEKTEKTVTTVSEASSPCVTTSLPDFTPLKGKSLNDPAVYNQLLDMAGNYCASGMVFKVQIGAYRHPENYKYANLKQYGNPEKVDYPDGITRFTQKQFSTIKEAEVHRQKCIAKGQTDAWIVAFVNGKRYTLEELIVQDFLGKSVN